MAAEVPTEVVTDLVEKTTASVTDKKDTWIGTLFKWMSQIFVFWIVILAIQIAFSIYATWTFNAKKKSEAESLNVHDLKKGLDAVVFSPDDVSAFVPAPGAVQDIRSDRTTQDLLQGKYGPVIVLFSSDWCPQCKNMMPAQEQAAAKSDVPFVKVDGQQPTQTMKHFKVAGYPTIYGVDSDNRVWPYATQRTTEEFLNFARKLKSKNEEIKAEPIQEIKAEAIQEIAKELPVAEPPKETVHVSVEVLDEDTEIKVSEEVNVPKEMKPEESSNEVGN